MVAREQAPLQQTMIKRKPLKIRKVPSKGKKRRKKGEITKLKEKLWQLCRAIIIQRYGNDCYTCPAKGLQGANLQGGHFISSSICSVELRYSLDNIRPQCFSCNIHKSGNWLSYETHLKADGMDVEALKRRNEATKGIVYKREWFEDTISLYQKLLETTSS